MQNPFSGKTRFFLLSILLLLSSQFSFSQNQNSPSQKSDFWQHVQFGGALALNFGTNYTEVTVAPGAIYNFNRYFALGTGIQGTYISSKGNYESNIYGASIIGLFNPIPQIQLSTEIEELHVHYTQNTASGISFKDDYWNTGVFLGAGYHSNNVTVGVRYNVTFNAEKNIYGDAWMPFVRVYF